MILPTNLEHVASNEEFEQLLSSHDNVMLCCGRMGPMCVPVYAAMDELRGERAGVAFRDMAFDSPVANVVRAEPVTRRFRSLPFTMYYKNGKLVKATSGIQSKAQVEAVLDEVFGS